MAAVITDNDIRAAAEEFAAVMNAYDASPADGSVLSERHIQAMAKLFARSGSRRRSRRKRLIRTSISISTVTVST